MQYFQTVACSNKMERRCILLARQKIFNGLFGPFAGHNPIENVWPNLKPFVEMKNPQRKHELIQKVRESQREIFVSITRNLMSLNPKSLAACCSNSGKSLSKKGPPMNELLYVSQASACDGNLYSICHNYQKALPNTIHLN